MLALNARLSQIMRSPNYAIAVQQLPPVVARRFAWEGASPRANSSVEGWSTALCLPKRHTLCLHRAGVEVLPLSAAARLPEGAARALRGDPEHQRCTFAALLPEEKGTSLRQRAYS